MKLSNTLTEIRQMLKENIDLEVLNSEKKYFKEEVITLGVKFSNVTRLSKQFYETIKDSSKEDIFALCEELWKSGYLEEACMAGNFAYYIADKYQPEDIIVFEHWINSYVTNWASCDTLCNHSVGTLVEMYPQIIADLKEWAKSPNRWFRRAAAVALIIPARKGLFREDIFAIADILLTDEDDLVRKGYGWMLKATSEAYRDDVFDYVMDRKAVMPRTALRYAIEKMPADMKAEAMKK